MSQYEPMYDSFNRNMRDRYVPTSRMSVSASVYLPGSDVDMYTGMVKPDRQRRRRTQGKRLEAERLAREEKRIEEAIRREESKGGVRISVRSGILILSVLMFVCGMVLLYQHGMISSTHDRLVETRKKVEACMAANKTLEEEIAANSTETKIKYAASRNLGMVPDDTVAVIHLTAGDTRPASYTNLQPREQETVTVYTSAAQSTPVPVSASN